MAHFALSPNDPQRIQKKITHWEYTQKFPPVPEVDRNKAEGHKEVMLWQATILPHYRKALGGWCFF